MKVGVGLWGRDQVGHRPRPGSGSGRGNQTGVLVGPGTGAGAGVRMASCCPVCPPLAARGSASPPPPPMYPDTVSAPSGAPCVCCLINWT